METSCNMEDNAKQKGGIVETQMDIKVEPTMQCYVEEEHENGFSSFENATNAIPSTADVGALNLWTSKATTCLISQYKKYRSMVGQSTQIRSLREMFEMISLEMQNYGFYFSPQKCENKWRVLERKYKNLVFRERLKKPGRMRHYGYWEHKRALDEIFNEKTRHMYLEESDHSPPPPSQPAPVSSTKYALILPKPTGDEQGNASGNQDDPLAPMASTATPAPPPSTARRRKPEESVDPKAPSLVPVFEKFFNKFFDEMKKNFQLAEKNKDKRHLEEMQIRQSELEISKRLLKIKEQKLELQKRQIFAAAQNLHLNM